MKPSFPRPALIATAIVALAAFLALPLVAADAPAPPSADTPPCLETVVEPSFLMGNGNGQGQQCQGTVVFGGLTLDDDISCDSCEPLCQSLGGSFEYGIWDRANCWCYCCV